MIGWLLWAACRSPAPGDSPDDSDPPVDTASPCPDTGPDVAVADPEAPVRGSDFSVGPAVAPTLGRFAGATLEWTLTDPIYTAAPTSGGRRPDGECPVRYAADVAVSVSVEGSPFGFRARLDVPSGRGVTLAAELGADDLSAGALPDGAVGLQVGGSFEGDWAAHVSVVEADGDVELWTSGVLAPVP